MDKYELLLHGNFMEIPFGNPL